MMESIGEILVKKWMEGLTKEERMAVDRFSDNIISFAKGVEEVGNALAQAFRNACQRTEDNYNRSELLKLYRNRHSWKKADVSRIKTYRLNKFAQNRLLHLEKSKLVGRGKTVRHIPIGDNLAGIGKYLVMLIDPKTLPHHRVYLLKQHSTWWHEIVESTYRGEFERLKELGEDSPSKKAEEAVANSCYMSPESIRRLCIAVRKDPVARTKPCRAMTVADFESWKKSGQFPPEENIHKT